MKKGLLRTPEGWRRHRGRRLFWVLLFVLSCALCVSVSVLVDALEKQHGWQVDFSYNAITTQGDETLKLLQQLDKDVRLYAVFSDGKEDGYLTALLDRYQAASSHIVWSRENLNRNPLLLSLASSEDGDSTVTSDCLIVQCTATNRVRVLTETDYMTYTYDAATDSYEAVYTYEKSISEAILYVSSDALQWVQILTGHGELSAEDTALLEEKLHSANYQTRHIHLLGGDVPDSTYPLLILSPMKDITSQELDTLVQYVHDGGDLMITVDFTCPDELPNFYALYREYGFEPLPGMILADSEDTSSYYLSVTNLLPVMLSTEVTGPMVLADADLIILAGARGFEQAQSTATDLSVLPALMSGSTAVNRMLRLEDDTVSVVEDDLRDRTGSFPLALCADRAFSDGMHSRAFIIGSSSLFLDEWMYRYTYSEELLLQITSYLQGKAPSSLGIAARTATRPLLNALSSPVPYILLAAVPLGILVAALAVLKPRKHL